MALKLIIGRSNTGKTHMMYDDIKTLEDNNQKCIVFVPDFARIVAEKEYFKYTQNFGMINTKITTLKRFAEQNVDKRSVYDNKDFLPEMSKKYIVKKCILDNGEKFNVFKKVMNTQGFADKMYKFMSTFESENLSKDKVDKVLKRNDFLSCKFKEIYEIYEDITNITKGRFVTSMEILDIFTNSLNGNKYCDDNNYFFDYYNNFNEKEFEYIKALLLINKNVTITLDLDMENKELSDVFAISYDTYRRIISIAKEVGCYVDEVVLPNRKDNKAITLLEHLKQNIFVLGAPKIKKNDDTVLLRLLKNPFDEIEYIAQDITAKVRNKGYRYSDFKIYYNNANMYDTCIKRVFSEYNIPFYINSKNEVASETIVIFLNCLLKQVATGFVGISVDNVIQLLKTGLIQCDMSDVYMFENYMMEFGIKLYNFPKKFEKNNKEGVSQNVVYNLDRINAIRERVCSLVMNLKNNMVNTTDTKNQATVLYNFLHSSGVIEEYQMQIEMIKRHDINEYNKKKQIIKNIYEIMDDIAIAFNNLDLTTYVELFIYGLQNIKLKSIPPYIDQVEVGDIDSTRSLPRKNVYIIGTYENGLPIISNTESIFSDKEISALEDLEIKVEKTSESRNNMALFNVYKAINSCEEKLIFTIPSSKLTGENLRLSPVIWRIKDVIDIEVEGNVVKEDTKKVFCIKNVYGQFVSELDSVKIDKNKENILLNYMMLMQDEKYAKILNYRRNVTNLEDATVKRLYKNNINSSVSRLESFKSCPFKYFSNYVLNLKIKKEYNFSTLDLGNIMHKVLEDFSKFLLLNDKGFQDVLSDEKTIRIVKEQIDKCIDEIFENSYEKFDCSPRYIYLKNKLKIGMLKVIIYISKSFSQSEFRPLGFEIEFDNNKLFAPIEITLSNDKKMYLKGKIDRVDVAKIKETTYLRVVDYKSSNKDLKLSDVKEGVALQLMTYMATLLENKDKIDDKNAVLPVAVSYLTLNTEMLNLSESVKEDEISEKMIEKMKMKGIYLKDVEVLKKLDNSFNFPKESYIDMTTKKLNNENKALTEEKFLEECNNIKGILQKIADEIVTGKVSPSEKDESCKYCNYSGICKKTLKSM